MMPEKVRDKHLFKSINSLPMDFRYVGDQSVDRMMFPGSIPENVEGLRDDSEGAANGRAHVGSDNDESPYFGMQAIARDGASLGDDADFKEHSTPMPSIKQLYADSKWSDTTLYMSKKVFLEHFFL